MICVVGILIKSKDLEKVLRCHELTNRYYQIKKPTQKRLTHTEQGGIEENPHSLLQRKSV